MSGADANEGTARDLRLASRDLLGRALFYIREGRLEEANVCRRSARVLAARARRRQAAEDRAAKVAA